MKRKIIFLLIFGFTSVFAQEQTTKLNTDIFGSITSRHIGPATMSGRIGAIDAVNDNWYNVYVGAAGGGLWKSTNGGTTFKPVFDKYTQSIGSITIDQKHPDTVWVGTGETWVRNSVSIGNGIYKTTDGGSNWKLMGLEKTERIAKIIIDPNNHDVVYAAATGPLFSESDERGVYKSTDGGVTWNKILYIDQNTGCSSIDIDYSNPNILYAGMWEFRRKAYTFNSGGKGSGLYRSSDAGNTWQKIAENLPEGDLGRICVTVSPVDPSVVFALIEAKQSGLFKSTDKGESWEKVNDTPTMGERPFYFSLIIPDPVELNRIYKPGFSLNVSTDGGKIFSSPFVEGGAIHGDLHALWINPKDNHEMYVGTDGGVYVSHDRGSSWNQIRNLPVSQFYHVSVDMKKPYNVYGGLQDNGSWVGPSTSTGGISNSDWKNVGFGDGFYVFPDHTDENILYWQWQGGNIVRHYLKSGESKEIKPYSEDVNEILRFNWNTPVAFSPSKERVMYVGAQYLFRSTDNGDSWEKISPDLTTNDPEKQKQEQSGGLTIDNSTAENHCTIYTINESPLNSKIIWAGTDDGNIQVTKDGGKSWQNVSVNITGLPANTWCSNVYSSNFDEATAYATFDGHYNGDMNTYIFKTTDYGNSWYSLNSQNLKGYAHVIREDLVNKNLLFLGTELGLFVSIDAGKSWSQFTGETPNVAVRDIVIHPTENDLVAATHGRGILIIDDLTPIRNLSVGKLNEELVFLETKPFPIKNPGQEQVFGGDDEFTGRNESETAIITYYLQKRHVFGDMFIEIYNDKNEKVATLPAGKNKGINRVKWFIRQKPPKVKASLGTLGRTFFGPTFPPGNYTVKIIKGDKTYSGNIKLIYDPDSQHSIADLDLQYQTALKAYKLTEELGFLDKQTTDLKDKLQKKSVEIKNDEPLMNSINELSVKLETLHKELVSTNPSRLSGEERLMEKVTDIYGAIMGYQGRPTESQLKRLTSLEVEVSNKRNYFEEIFSSELNKINEELKSKSLSVILLMTKEEYLKDNSY